MITLQNYNQKRSSFNTASLSKDELEIFNSVDNEFEDYMELYNEVPEIKSMLDEHIKLVNDLFKAPAQVKTQTKKDNIHFQVQLFDNNTKKWKALHNIDHAMYVSNINKEAEERIMSMLDATAEEIQEIVDDNTFDFGGYRLVDKKGKVLKEQMNKKEEPTKKTTAKKETPTKKIEKVVDKNEVSHFTNEYMLIRRFYNAIKNQEVLTFNKVRLMYSAFNKTALERKVRATSKDVELFETCHEKVTKMFKASDENESHVEVVIKDEKLLDTLMEYVGDTKINYAITLLKSFISQQGKKPEIIKAERLLKRFENAILKERVTCANRLWKPFLDAKKELASYIKDSSSPIEPKQVALSITEKKKELNNEQNDESDTDIDISVDNNLSNDIDISIPYKEYLLPVANAVEESSKVLVLDAEEKREASVPIPNGDIEDVEQQIRDKEQKDFYFENVEKDFNVLSEQLPIEPVKTHDALPETHFSSGLSKRMSDNKDYQAVYYKLQGDFAKFIGNIEIKPKESVAITLDAEQGAGKTRLMFQMLDVFSGAGYKCLFISLEEHPDSQVFIGKQNEYISVHNQSRISTIGENPETFADLKEDIEANDIIFIDSWSKLAELNSALDFDRDLRKAFDGKLFIVVFQRTGEGKMRGGSKSQFDGDIIMRMEKAEDYRNTYAFFNKHRYHDTPLLQLKFNTFTKTLMSNEEEYSASDIEL